MQAAFFSFGAVSSFFVVEFFNYCGGIWDYNVVGVTQVYYWRESSRLPHHSVTTRIKSKSFKANGPRLSGTLTGLIPYSNYKMYIVVANNRYEGPPSNTIEFQTLEGGNDELIIGLIKQS